MSNHRRTRGHSATATDLAQIESISPAWFADTLFDKVDYSEHLMCHRNLQSASHSEDGLDRP